MKTVNNFDYQEPEFIDLGENTNNLEIFSNNVQITNDANINLTGLQLPVDMQFAFILLCKKGAGTLTIKANSMMSEMPNRFRISADVVLNDGEYLCLLSSCIGIVRIN